MSKRGSGEGSIFKRGDGRWAAALNLGYEGGRRRRKHLYGRTRGEVAQKLQRVQRTLADGGVLTAERQTVATLLEAWLSDSAASKVRPRTLQRYREIVRLHLIPALGRVRLSKLTPAHVERMRNEALARGVSPRSAAHHRAVLRTALNVAMRWGWIGRNAASLAEPPRIPEREVRPLAPSDARALLQAVRGDRLEALFTVALACGLRQGEALALRWPDMDLERGTLTVQRSLQRVGGEWRFVEPKTARSRRIIPLPAPVIASLREHRARQLGERLRVGAAWEGQGWGDLVFTDELGRPLSGFHVLRRFKALLALAGLPPMRYHDLRHGAASLMAVQGVPARVAMELLGHAQISTTMNIYAHVAPELQRDAAERVSQALWG
ncbi:MAG: integrase [Chloroflexi bacterium RBG_16_68_14]|nr:MAG: integrase [Chloroflexi bacterium RBG_16_68_14]